MAIEFMTTIALLVASSGVSTKLAAYYSFDSGVGMRDLSGNGHQGTALAFIGSDFTGIPLGPPSVDSTTFKLGDGSLKLDEQGVLGMNTSSQGSNGQYVLVTSLASGFHTGDDSAISLWFRTDRGVGAENQQHDGSVLGSSQEWNDLLVGCNTANDNAYRVGIDLVAGGLEGRMWLDAGDGVTLGDGYNDGKWHHLVVNNNGTTGETHVFVNAVLIGIAWKSVDWNSVTSMALGMDLDGADPGDFFDGWIDDAAFFKGQLSLGEIDYLYCNGLGHVVPAPPLCYGDANDDGLIDGADMSVLLSQFNEIVSPGTGADFNADGQIDSADLSVLLGRFGLSCV